MKRILIVALIFIGTVRVSGNALAVLGLRDWEVICLETEDELRFVVIDKHLPPNLPLQGNSIESRLHQMEIREPIVLKLYNLLGTEKQVQYQVFINDRGFCLKLDREQLGQTVYIVSLNLGEIVLLTVKVNLYH
ncbi:MAG: hypothetical protein IH946_00880 [Bacteroidetes bacterium]|nr:hypothetical protein [Bacteroidota bacterium]